MPSATAGNNLSLKATVTGVGGGPSPTGNVVFVEEANIRSALQGTAAAPLTLGTATLAGGVATLSVPTVLTGAGLIPDVYEIEAFYQGSGNTLAAIVRRRARACPGSPVRLRSLTPGVPRRTQRALRSLRPAPVRLFRSVPGFCLRITSAMPLQPV